LTVLAPLPVPETVFVSTVYLLASKTREYDSAFALDACELDACTRG
jgi:hypothetical protein